MLVCYIFPPILLKNPFFAFFPLAVMVVVMCFGALLLFCIQSKNFWVPGFISRGRTLGWTRTRHNSFYSCGGIDLNVLKSVYLEKIYLKLKFVYLDYVTQGLPVWLRTHIRNPLRGQPCGSCLIQPSEVPINPNKPRRRSCAVACVAVAYF